MPLTPDEFYARALAHADAEHRLPMPEQTAWEIFPFEADSLVTKPFEPPVLPEPPRTGEGDGSPCWRCRNPEADVFWQDERWTFGWFAEPVGILSAALMPKAHLDLGDLDDTHAAELGLLTVRIDRALRNLGGIGRVHVSKWGDGGSHLHVMFFARPAGLLQLRGSLLTLWEEMLPRLPEDVVAADLATVAAELAAYGGEVVAR